MLQIRQIQEHKDVLAYLEKRQLTKQYEKAKQYILSGEYQSVDLKIREPKHEGVWYFRINRQFRAWGYMEGEILKIFTVDNHQ